MDKLLEFGRKAMFYVRVLSGYEERRIRSYRLQLQQRLQKVSFYFHFFFSSGLFFTAEEKKVALQKVPEQIILSEVRQMVQDMQSMNKKLEETEAAIEEYFKPIDKDAELLMKTQLEGEEKTMREMMKAMQSRAFLDQAEVEKTEKLKSTQPDQHIEGSISSDKRAQVS
ncbi:uncharacterized protein [Primulina huaijiensis]|uniref:uncharacterized protein isoform X1 n=1 Tax=Primulina huaijiensis TaxID=1492673 RepID=UPI003CC76CEE